jgi:uncharacterized protein (DUF1810 family)
MLMDEQGLERFVAAQEGVYATALAEIRRGAKRTHWMWFVFPQIAGLGQSPTARFYAIGTLAEARAYLAHPVLGARLRECVAALDQVAVPDARAVFGSIDAVKLRSSLTLFEAAGGGEELAGALERWFGGERDGATLRLLGI